MQFCIVYKKTPRVVMNTIHSSSKSKLSKYYCDNNLGSVFEKQLHESILITFIKCTNSIA